MTILADFGKAVAQLRDPKFTKILVKTLLVTALLLAALFVPFYWLIGLILPETLTIPFIGIYHPEAWLAKVAVGFTLIVGGFLMFPVAMLIIGIFLEEITAAVEAKYYPHLPKVTPLGYGEIIGDAVRFMFVMVFANLAALIIYFTIAPLAPFIFWIVNGYLLGREYFQLVAMRRLGGKKATRMRRDNGGKIWLAGILMAIPLSIPVINLLVPLLGVATFTHMYHRLNGEKPTSDHRNQYR